MGARTTLAVVLCVLLSCVLVMSHPSAPPTKHHSGANSTSKEKQLEQHVYQAIVKKAKSTGKLAAATPEHCDLQLDYNLLAFQRSLEEFTFQLTVTNKQQDAVYSWQVVWSFRTASSTSIALSIISLQGAFLLSSGLDPALPVRIVNSFNNAYIGPGEAVSFNVTVQYTSINGSKELLNLVGIEDANVNGLQCRLYASAPLQLSPPKSGSHLPTSGPLPGSCAAAEVSFQGGDAAAATAPSDLVFSADGAAGSPCDMSFCCGGPVTGDGQAAAAYGWPFGALTAIITDVIQAANVFTGAPAPGPAPEPDAVTAVVAAAPLPALASNLVQQQMVSEFQGPPSGDFLPAGLFAPLPTAPVPAPAAPAPAPLVPLPASVPVAAAPEPAALVPAPDSGENGMTPSLAPDAAQSPAALIGSPSERQPGAAEQVMASKTAPSTSTGLVSGVVVAALALLGACGCFGIYKWQAVRRARRVGSTRRAWSEDLPLSSPLSTAIITASTSAALLPAHSGLTDTSTAGMRSTGPHQIHAYTPRPGQVLAPVITSVEAAARLSAARAQYRVLAEGDSCTHQQHTQEQGSHRSRRWSWHHTMRSPIDGATPPRFFTPTARSTAHFSSPFSVLSQRQSLLSVSSPQLGAVMAAASSSLLESQALLDAMQRAQSEPLDPLLHGSQAALDLDFEAEIELEERIGGGAFGSVYKAKWRGRAVAVKVMQALCLADGSSDLQIFQHEVRVLSSLKHERITCLLGACMAPPHICIVQELAQDSLYNRLHPVIDGLRTCQPMPYPQLLQIAIDVADALAYLHPSVVHRDLKSQNVLLDDEDRGKVCDFGIARFKDRTFISTQNGQAGTPSYMAPEMFEGSRVTEKIDVYSFAVLLWEMFTGQVPWNHLSTPMQVIYVVGVLKERLKIATECPDFLARLMRECWQEHPPLRPAFTVILHQLQEEQRRCQEDLEMQQE